jgi:phenolic acid decarboxylase
LGISILALVSAAASAQNVSQQPQAQTMSFVGKSLHFRYASGLEVTGHYATASDLTWEALTGPSKGSKGTEKVHAQEVAPKVFFISWLEKSGTSVSQVLDLNQMKVTAFVTFEGGNGRQSMFDHGTLTEVNRRD